MVCDNSSLHHEEEMSRDLYALLDANGISLCYLPTFSPETNPCELVFARAKRYMRDERGDDEFVVEVAKGFAHVEADMVLAFYKKCIVDL